VRLARAPWARIHDSTVTCFADEPLTQRQVEAALLTL